jgi:hypothetical protein
VHDSVWFHKEVVVHDSVWFHMFCSPIHLPVLLCVPLWHRFKFVLS